MFASIDTLWNPKEAFARLRDRDRGGWLGPLLVVVVVGAVAGGFHLSRMDLASDMLEQMTKNLPEGQSDAVEQLESILPWIVGWTRIQVVLAPIIALLVSALIAWLLPKVFSGQGRFGQALGVVAMAHLPQAFGGLLTVPVALMRSEPPGLFELQSLLRTHPAAFTSMEADNPLFLLSAGLDLLSLWVLGLTILGTTIVLKVPPKASAATWIVLKLAMVALTVGGAAAGAAAQAHG